MSFKHNATFGHAWKINKSCTRVYENMQHWCKTVDGILDFVTNLFVHGHDFVILHFVCKSSMCRLLNQIYLTAILPIFHVIKYYLRFNVTFISSSARSLQLRCGDTRQIWKQIKETTRYFVAKLRIFLTGKLTKRALLTTHTINTMCRRNSRLISKQKRAFRVFEDQQQPNCRHTAAFIPA